MTDLEALSVPPPRPGPLCARFVRRMDPWWGFVIAGGLLTLGCFITASLIGIQIDQRLGLEDGSTGAQVSALISLVVGLGSAVAIFRWWRGRRLGAKRELIRAGKLLEMTVGEVRVGRGSKRYSNLVELARDGKSITCGFNLWFRPSPGDTVHVLYKAGLTPVLAFSRTGSMCNGQVV